MPEWWLIAIAIWCAVMFSGRRGCGWRGDRRTAPDSERLASRSGRSHARRTGSAPRETAEQRLQREFVDGRLTMDEYERELARVLRPGRGEPGVG